MEVGELDERATRTKDESIQWFCMRLFILSTYSVTNLLKVADPVSRLQSDPEELLRDAEARPEFQSKQEEAKQRRVAQVVCPMF
jgi:hypothetical protein